MSEMISRRAAEYAIALAVLFPPSPMTNVEIQEWIKRALESGMNIANGNDSDIKKPTPALPALQPIDSNTRAINRAFTAYDRKAKARNVPVGDYDCIAATVEALAAHWGKLAHECPQLTPADIQDLGDLKCTPNASADFLNARLREKAAAL